jgi:branched-chain amino acid transport system ATP-binding protein
VSCLLPGTLTAIVGPNGAGKTTYFNLISGQLPPSSGSVLLDGDDITGAAGRRAHARGIGRAFQLTNLFPNLSVLENVRLAVQAQRGLRPNLWSLWSSHRDWIDKAEHYLERVVNLADKRDTAGGGAAAWRQAQARSRDHDGAGAARLHVRRADRRHEVDEVPVILDLIKALKERRRQDHPARRAQDGRGALPRRPHHRAAQRPAGRRRRARAVIASPVVQEAYLGVGQGAAPEIRPGWPPMAEPLLTTCSRACTPTSASITSCRASTFEVPRGGITVLLGRNGAGKTTTLRTIMGLWKPSQGRITFAAATSAA